jgi:hypothetical protein
MEKKSLRMLKPTVGSNASERRRRSFPEDEQLVVGNMSKTI